jgi:hypothetical protein
MRIITNQFGGAGEHNVGWRIDYQIATPRDRQARAQGVDPYGEALFRSRPGGDRL